MSASVLVALAASACGGVVRFGDLDPPPGRKVVVDVEIEGNDELGAGTLTDGLFTYADLWRDGETDESLLDLTELPDDIERIEAKYAREGYFDARVTDYRVERRAEGTVEVIFVVDEGAGPTTVTAIEIEGIEPEEITGESDAALALAELNDEALDIVSLNEGDIWTETEHQASIAALETRMRELGFAHGEVVGSAFVDREARESRVVFQISHGPLVRIGNVRVTGLRRVEESRVLRRVDLEENQIATTDALEEQEEQIFDLEAFFVVTATLDGPSLEERLGGRPETFETLESIRWPEVADVVFEVQERPLHELRTRVGASADSQRAEAYVIAGYENGNFLGDLRQLEIEGGPKAVFLPIFWDPEAELSAAGLASLEFVQPSFVEEYIRLSTRLDYQLYVQEGAKNHEITVSPRFRRRFLRYFTAELGYEFSWFQYFEVTEAFQRPSTASLGFEFREEFIISQLVQAITADFRDDPLDPREWAYFSASTAEALEGLGSDFQYFRYILDGRLYFTFWEPLTIALRTRFGQVIPIGIEVPISARLRGGGATGVRGFATGQMGPISCPNPSEDGRIDLVLDVSECGGTSNDRIFVGGNLLLESSVELRARLPFTLLDWPIGLVAFLDVGQIFDEATEFSTADLEYAVGPGVRWLTEFGPIRFDLGFLLTSPSPPDIEFHFSLGQAF